jgi:hypothetical protein
MTDRLEPTGPGLKATAAAAGFLSSRKAAILKRRGGEVLDCLHAADVPEGCGRAPSCRNCVILFDLQESARRQRIMVSCRGLFQRTLGGRLFS